MKHLYILSELILPRQLFENKFFENLDILNKVKFKCNLQKLIMKL